MASWQHISMLKTLKPHMFCDESGVLGVSMAFSAGHAEENSQWMCCFERNRRVCENLAFLHR